jgi:hypothetical protein
MIIPPGSSPAARAGGVGGIGIRDVQRPVRAAARVAVVQQVRPFRRALVPLAPLVAGRRAAQGDAVRLERPPAAQQHEGAVALVDEHAVGVRVGGERGRTGAVGPRQRARQRRRDDADGDET